jgi:2-dehydropantoate 2-reductase
MSEVAILGPGGVGGFLAAALEHAGAPVTVVAREETAAVIAERGIAVESVRLGQFQARPRAVPSLDATGAVLIVATKATGLDVALQRVQGEPGLVVPLLNGLDHLVPLRERFGAAVVAASIRIEATRVATGRIEQTSPFLRIDVGPPSAAVEAFAATMRAAEVPVDVLDSEAQVMWGKLVRLNAIALSTSAYDLPAGAIRDDPDKRAVVQALIEEAAAVARAEGADVDPGRTIAEVEDLHPTLQSSMQRDIRAGRPPELDAIAGSVIRAARRHGIPTPTIERVAGQVAERAGIVPPR